MQQIVVQGRIGQDAEIKELPSGKRLIEFSIAHSENFIQNGQSVEKTTWFNAVKWIEEDIKTGIVAYLKKGDNVTVIGQVSARAWVDPQGRAKASLDIRIQSIHPIFAKKDGAATAPVEFAQAAILPQDDDDLPF